QAGLLLGERDHAQALLAQRRGDGLLGDALDLAVGRDSRPVDRLVGPDRRAHAATGVGIMPCASRRISTGCEDRDSASAMVIRPSRTRPASEASIVCIPCSPPVWISE